jgi:hypothetical protein
LPRFVSVSTKAEHVLDGASPQASSNGLRPAILVGAAVLAIGAIAALLVPGKHRAPVLRPTRHSALLARTQG